MTPKQRREKRVEAVSGIAKEYPDASVRLMSKLAFQLHPNLFKTEDEARNCIRMYAGKRKNRDGEKVETIELGERKGSTNFALPQSKAKPWMPYELKGKTVAVFSDCHFPKHDVRAIESAVAHVKNEGDVDAVLLNGDFADAEEFSSWAKSPKAIDTENTLENIRQGLLYFRDQFPKAKIVYKYGNHEERLERYCWSRAPELVGLDHITWKGLLTIGKELKPVDELRDVEFVGEQRPILVGKLPIFHGHELPKGLTNAVNPARGAFLRMMDTVVIGHHHRSSSHVEYDWRHKATNCWSVGCLCDLTPEYARINKWNHGHMVVEVSECGSFNVLNYKQLETGEVVTA